MKKSNFVALILGTIGVVFFALGMCMGLLPEWGMFRQGVVCGVIGLVILLLTVLIWRKMEGKAPIQLRAKTVGAAAVGVLGGTLSVPVPERGPDPGQQLLNGKGLGHIVVRARVQA